MKPSYKERLFWWIAVPVLASVLVALAVMQFRWSDQVSAATKAQMQSGLQTAMFGFRLDLLREMTAVCLELRSAADESGTVRPAQLAQQFRHWQQTAPHPALVEQVYLFRSSESGEGTLLRLDSTRDQLERASWPAGFESLQQSLQVISPLFSQPVPPIPHRHGRGPQAGPGVRSVEAFLPWFVDQSIPALVYPLRPRSETGEVGEAPSITWILIQLNGAVLNKEIFPELAQKYFRGPAGLDYHVAVLAGGSGHEHAIYSSHPGFAGQNPLVIDGALNLLGPPFRRTESAGASPGQDPFTPGGRTGILTRLVPPDERRNPAMERLVRFEPLQRSREEGVWQIVAKHQRGSVEAAVNGLRQRHVLASFGVLVLLALTMALVLIASQRARRLAALQMNFVAGVSHELRTPLAVISSAAENIAHGVVADKSQLERYGTSILKQTRQLTQLVEQVLVFAATQQKQGHYDLRPVDVGQVIDAALENTASISSPKISSTEATAVGLASGPLPGVKTARFAK
jgi:hypothetical protein